MLCANAHAKNLLDACHASSSYDVTIKPDAILFDRAQPAPRRVRMHEGTLRVDGTPVTLGAADHGRMVRFEQTVRALEPKVKTIADQAVDLAAQAVREQAAQSTPQLAASGQLDARLNADARDLKARIARSHSTHDWQGPAFQKYVNQTVADIMPLLANDLLQQAITVAVSGDLDAAAQLRNRAANLATTLQTRVQQRLQVLRPKVQALCPSLQRLDWLESGIDTPLPGGARLDLIDMARSGHEGGTK
jgi:hypothetical protein